MRIVPTEANMKKLRIGSILKMLYVIFRTRKIESLTLCIYLIVVIFFTYLFMLRLIDFGTFIGTVVALCISLVSTMFGFIRSQTKVYIISSVANYLLRGDISLIDELLGKLITGRWEITTTDPSQGFFDALEDISYYGSYEMRRRVAEALPALYHWELKRAEKIAKVLRDDWDDKYRSDIRRRVVEGVLFLLSKKPESADFFLSYHEKDEVFTAMAVIEIANEWFKYDRKKRLDFFNKFHSMVQKIYSAQEIEGLNYLIDLLETISINPLEAVNKMKDASKNQNVYIRIAIARNLSKVVEKFPRQTFYLMEYFLRPEEHEWVRRPIAREKSTKAIINAIKNPRLEIIAKRVLWKLIKDSDQMIRIAAFDLVDELREIDSKLYQKIVNYVANNEANEDLQRRAKRLLTQISQGYKMG
jgi:hypothetical protein